MLSEVGTEQYDKLEDGSHKAKHSVVWSVRKRVEMQDGVEGVLQVSRGSYIWGS